VADGGGFDLIETMRFDPEDGIAELERHLSRMKASADALGFAFDRHAARNELQAATFFLRGARLLRLRLSPTGAVAVEARPVPPSPAQPVEVALAPLGEDGTARAHMTSAGVAVPEGAFETIFVDGDGFLTQGSFTSLFVKRRGLLLTPPRSRGIRDGVLRGKLIEEGRAREAELTAADLADPFLIGSAATGLLQARLR
jgi:para-aminobenzoate synthetase/4-amino-4-deoxychorismate lyase